ncbi:MAG: polysaccharide biosynthesis C-terminal domain-containing protein, partial [Nanoarchaeota archaeon]
RVDTLMLSAMKGYAATGLYGAAYRITEALTFIPIVVVTAVFPALSKLHTQSRESVKAVYEKTFYYLLIAAVPMAVGLTIIADRVVLFFYGQEFAASVIALKLLVWAEALIFVHYVMGFLLNAIDKQHLFTIVTAAYTAANVALNLVLIPKYSYAGAAAVAVITQAIAVLALYYLCTKNGYGFNIFKLIYKPGIAASGMAVALAGLKGAHLLIAAPAAAAVYIALLILVGGVGKEELVLIRKVFSRQP